MMVMSTLAKKAITAATLLALTTLAMINTDKQLNALRTLKKSSRRSLAVDLGNGDCVYEPPNPDVDPDLNLHKYLLAGFPSGDKRMVYIQMETLTGLPSKDDWDFVFNGYTNAPFIKTNYPHPSGTWSWGSEANEVFLVVQFIRRSLVEYADVTWYQMWARTYNSERQQVEDRYGDRKPLNDWYRWRDERVLEEIYRYGAYIDYWMENGRIRDPISHLDVDQEMWALLIKPIPISHKLHDYAYVCKKTTSTSNPYIEMKVSRSVIDIYISHGDFYGTCADAAQDATWMATAPQTYLKSRDPNCESISGSCSPTIVVSADKLRDYTDGPQETELIARHLQTRMSDYVVSEAAWPCIWTKIIHENKGPMTFDDRMLSEDPGFSAFMLGEMLYEINRMIAKYSTTAWTSTNPRAVRLVSIFQEHRELIKAELIEVTSGARTLKISDYMSPSEREQTHNEIGDDVN